MNNYIAIRKLRLMILIKLKKYLRMLSINRLMKTHCLCLTTAFCVAIIILTLRLYTIPSFVANILSCWLGLHLFSCSFQLFFLRYYFLIYKLLIFFIFVCNCLFTFGAFKVNLLCGFYWASLPTFCSFIMILLTKK